MLAHVKSYDSHTARGAQVHPRQNVRYGGHIFQKVDGHDAVRLFDVIRDIRYASSGRFGVSIETRRQHDVAKKARARLTQFTGSPSSSSCSSNSERLATWNRTYTVQAIQTEFVPWGYGMNASPPMVPLAQSAPLPQAEIPMSIIITRQFRV